MTKSELLSCLADLPDNGEVYIDPMGVPPVVDVNSYPLTHIRRVEIMAENDPNDPNDPIAVIRAH